MARGDSFTAQPVRSLHFSKNVESRFDGDAGSGFECPYGGCSDVLESPDARREHMSVIHPEETRQRHDSIVQALALRTDWRARAACHGRELILEPTSAAKTARAKGDDDHLSQQEAAAVALCAGCPVRWECAELSINPPEMLLAGPLDPVDMKTRGTRHLTSWEPYGIWAGTRPHERKQVVGALGHGDEAIRALLAIGERRALDHPGDPAKLRTDHLEARPGSQADRNGSGGETPTPARTSRTEGPVPALRGGSRDQQGHRLASAAEACGGLARAHDRDQTDLTRTCTIAGYTRREATRVNARARTPRNPRRTRGRT